MGFCKVGRWVGNRRERGGGGEGHGYVFVDVANSHTGHIESLRLGHPWMMFISFFGVSVLTPPNPLDGLLMWPPISTTHTVHQQCTPPSSSHPSTIPPPLPLSPPLVPLPPAPLFPTPTPFPLPPPLPPPVPLLCFPFLKFLPSISISIQPPIPPATSLSHNIKCASASHSPTLSPLCKPGYPSDPFNRGKPVGSRILAI